MIGFSRQSLSISLFIPPLPSRGANQPTNKTQLDLLWYAIRRRCHQLNTATLMIEGSIILPSSLVRDFGVEL